MFAAVQGSNWSHVVEWRSGDKHGKCTSIAARIRAAGGTAGTTSTNEQSIVYRVPSVPQVSDVYAARVVGRREIECSCAVEQQSGTGAALWSQRDNKAHTLHRC